MAINAIVWFFVPVMAAGTLLAPAAGFLIGWWRGGRVHVQREARSFVRMMLWMAGLLALWIGPIVYVLISHGRRYDSVALAILPLGLLLFVTSALIGAEYARSGAVPPRGHCQKCGYNLTGNVSGVCPECGTALHT